MNITIPRAVVEQALEALEIGYKVAKAEADRYHTAMAGFRPERHAQMDAEVQEIARAITALRAALAEPEGGGNLPPPLQVPPEIAAALTITDLVWLDTRRLVKLWKELGQMRWAGADEGWDRAIEAVRNRINDECQAVLDWKSKADQSQATAVELLQKMKELKDD